MQIGVGGGVIAASQTHETSKIIEADHNAPTKAQKVAFFDCQSFFLIW